MKTIRFMVALLIWCAGQAGLVAAADPTASGSLTGTLIPREAFAPRVLAASGEVENVLLGLDYDKGEVPLVYAADFNGDGEVDFLIVSPERLCGTAGCVYSLLDGKTMREIGNFFGHVAILDVRINGFPVIQVMSKRDLFSVNLSTYVFDGGQFMEIGYALLSEPGVQEWNERIAPSPRQARPR